MEPDTEISYAGHNLYYKALILSGWGGGGGSVLDLIFKSWGGLTFFYYDHERNESRTGISPISTLLYILYFKDKQKTYMIITGWKNPSVFGWFIVLISGGNLIFALLLMFHENLASYMNSGWKHSFCGKTVLFGICGTFFHNFTFT